MLLSNETCPRLARAPDHCRPRRGAAQQMFSILYFILFHAKFGCDLQLVPALGWGGQGRGLERDYESCCRDDCRNVPGDWWPAHNHWRPFSFSCATWGIKLHSIMSQTPFFLRTWYHKIDCNGILHLNFQHEGSPVAASSTWEPDTGHSLVTGHGGVVQSGTRYTYFWYFFKK